MPVPDQARDDGSGIQFRFLDPGFRRDDDSPQADGVLNKMIFRLSTERLFVSNVKTLHLLLFIVAPMIFKNLVNPYAF
jgi:hypothetical protein